MCKEDKVTIKATLYSALLVFVGYILLKIPVIGFITECVILLIVFSYLYEVISELLYHKETQKEIDKINQISSKKKGK